MRVWIGLLLTVVVCRAQAEVIHVPEENGTIQGAIDASVDGDEIIVAAGRYVEVIDFHGKGIWLHSSDGPEATIISGQDLGFSVVTCTSGEGGDTILEGFTIRDGTGTLGRDAFFHGGGINIKNSDPTIYDCIVTRNRADIGAGISISLSSMAIMDCLITANGSEYFGGGIWNSESDLLVSDCTIRANGADTGGGLFSIDATLMLSDCLIEENNASAPPGADCECAGGAYNLRSSVWIDGCEFVNNTAEQAGGGMLNPRSDVTILNSRFVGNESLKCEGGAIVDGGRLEVRDSVFIGNHSTEGGAIDHGRGELIVSDCVFRENSSGGGGGIDLRNSDGALIVNSTFASNTAASGGAIFIENSDPVVLANCLLIHNDGGLNGGVISVIRAGSDISVVGCTAVDNTARDGSGIATRFSGGNTAIANSIFFNGGDEIFNDDGSSISVTYTDIQGGYAGAGNIDVDPRFVDPANDDYRLRSDSPCSDAGDNTSVPADGADLDGDEDTEEPTPFDLAGEPRFADNPCMDDTGNCGTPCERPIVDMGAYEVTDGVGCCIRDPAWQCDGDVDGDGQVNPVDAGTVQAAFCGGESCTDDVLCRFDLDCDGQVNPVDSGIVQSLFGTCEEVRPVCREGSGEEHLVRSRHLRRRPRGSGATSVFRRVVTAARRARRTSRVARLVESTRRASQTPRGPVSPPVATTPSSPTSRRQ